MSGSTLAGRIALVTGGGRGAGRAIVEALHARGASVVIADIGTGTDGDGADPSVAEDLARQLGDRAAAFTESVASPSAAAAAVDFAARRFGALDIVVNNAAIRRDAFVFEANPEAWDAVIRTNLGGAYYLIGAAAALMRRHQVAEKRGDGGGHLQQRIVNIVPGAVSSESGGQAACAAAAAGLVGLTRVLAQDMRHSGITCNAIAPLAPKGGAGSMRPGASAVAELVAWLAGPEAGHVTGQVFGVRGGDILLFAPPRPAVRLLDPGPGGLGAAIDRELAPHFVDPRIAAALVDPDSLP